MKNMNLSEVEKNKVAIQLYADAKKYINNLPKSQLKQIKHKDDFMQDLVTTMYACYDKIEQKGSYNEYQTLVFEMIRGYHTFNFNEFLHTHQGCPLAPANDRNLSYGDFLKLISNKNTSPLIIGDYLNLDITKLCEGFGISNIEYLTLLSHDNCKVNNITPVTEKIRK